MTPHEIRFEIIHSFHTDFVRGVKDTSTDSGPNMWFLQMYSKTGEWVNVNHLTVTEIEDLLCRPEPLTRYEDD